MISFFYQNKGHFRRCEDSLTSTVFDLLKYLPFELFWTILKKSLYHQKLPEVSGEILELTYWAKWNADDTQNERYIEPDVFIRFYNFDLIIEAKRHNEKQQKHYQILNEIRSYFNEFDVDNKDLYFIQLGGLNTLTEAEDNYHNGKKIILCKTDWTKLLDQIVCEKNKINNLDYSQTNSCKRILEDIIKGFEMHGYLKQVWLNSLDPITITDNNLNNLFEYAATN